MIVLKKFKFIDFCLFFLFLASVVCFLCFLVGKFTTIGSDKEDSSMRQVHDEFDSSFVRLNSIDKLMSYCDSFYQAKIGKRTYPGIVSEVIRKKFYHGYSYYNITSNAMGVFLEPLVKHGALAVVVPDDIVKFSHASCSQQSIVGMSIFNKRKYPVRKVTMFDSISNSGHFAYEVFYENGWHFFDTDQEPDTHLLREYNRPSVAFLTEHPDIVLKAYRMSSDPELFKRLIVKHKLGVVNEFAAPNAYLYQVITKYFNYFGWIFFGSLILLRYKLRKKNVSGLTAVTGRRKVSDFS